MKPKPAILIVDDEQPTIDSLEILLGDDFKLLVARSGEEALERVKSEPVDLVLLDITLPGMDGFETLKAVKRCEESIEVVMLTADERARTAMRAIELGAFHYITKPYEKDDILLIVQRAFEKKRLAEEVMSLKDDVARLNSFHNLVGQDPKMKELYALIAKVAAADSTVLITGESGTGKELVARAIHDRSARRDQHFKAINCAAIPEHLLESELFGHEKGAFTGAVERKIGKFEMAEGGTLLLDEISAMKESLQVKLLRVLQEREIERVGGGKPIAIDVRMIAATNAQMQNLVETGGFREDLYYRINVIRIHIPPLRERTSDIPFLADYFLKIFSKKFNKNVQGFTLSAQKTLEQYAWPGNVRELKNVVERAVVLTEQDFIGNEVLPLELSIPRGEYPKAVEALTLKSALEAYEKQVILNFLERVEWNQTKAADLLGIHRNTLVGKLGDYKISTKQLKQGIASEP